MLASLHSSGPDVLHASLTGVGILYIPVYDGHVPSDSVTKQHTEGTYYLGLGGPLGVILLTPWLTRLPSTNTVQLNSFPFLS